MSSHYISKIDYTRGDVLGTGAFGTVYKAYGSKRRTLYAVKDIRCSENDELDGAIDEIRALGNLIHQNIIKLYNVRATQIVPFQATLSLLLEYCARGDLNERLNKSSSNAKNFLWMRQIIDAVEYLHEHDVIHRDLKPQNVLLTSNETVKLADFGLATRFARKDANQTWYNYYMELGVGQACYVAPEVLLQHYNYKADIFSVGVIFYAILERTFQVVNGENHYGIFVDQVDGGKIQQPLGLEMFNGRKDIVPQFLKTKSEAIVQLLKEMLKYDQKERPTAEEIRITLLQHSPSCVIF